MSAAISKTKKIMAMRMRKKIISAYVCLGWTIRVRPMSAAISMTKKKMAMRMKMMITVPISAYVCLGWRLRVKLVKMVQPYIKIQESSQSISYTRGGRKFAEFFVLVTGPS